MDKESQELREVIADLKLIKEAVGKSDSIIRFIDARGALRGILLTNGSPVFAGPVKMAAVCFSQLLVR